MSNIYISKIFGPTIQGEGLMIGKPTVFVRVGGCDYRCTWCDTQEAVKPQYRDDWQKMTASEILNEVKKLTNNHPILITLSGGNPAIYDFSELIELGRHDGFTFALETQGSACPDYFSDLDYLTISPKAPSSRALFDPIKLENAIRSHSSPFLKIVVSDEKDYRFAKRIHKKYPDIPMSLQPCNPNAKEGIAADINALNAQLKWLINLTQNDSWYDITILPQLHVLISSLDENTEKSIE